MPAFERFRQDYLGDDGFRRLQQMLLQNPEVGDVITGTGGLRVICYWWLGGHQFWLFTLYDKDEMEDLTAKEKRILNTFLDQAIETKGTT